MSNESYEEDLTEFLKINYPTLRPLDLALGFLFIIYCPLAAFYLFLHGELLHTVFLGSCSFILSGMWINKLLNQIRKRSEIAKVVNQVRKGEDGFELGSLSQNLSYFDEEQLETLIGNLKNEEVI